MCGSCGSGKRHQGAARCMVADCCGHCSVKCCQDSGHLRDTTAVEAERKRKRETRGADAGERAAAASAAAIQVSLALGDSAEEQAAAGRAACALLKDF